MNSISLLQEMMQSRGQQLPVYTFKDLKTEKLVLHFECEVSANGKSASGQGKNKKEAKLAASTKLLQILKTSPLTDATATQGNNSVPKTEVTTDNEVNYIGRLQTFCQRSMKNLPTYEVAPCLNTVPLLFEATCRLADHTKTARGTNKQKAKQAAAKEMLYQLEWSSLERVKTSTPVSGKSQRAPTTGAAKNVAPSRPNLDNQFRCELADAALDGSDISTTDSDLDCVTRELEHFKLNKMATTRAGNESPMNSAADSGVSMGSDKQPIESCHLCDKGFKGCKPVVSRLSPEEVRTRLLDKSLPISDALHMFHHCDDKFFDSMDNIVDFLDLVINELNCVYFITFTKTMHNYESLCSLEVKEIRGSRFLGVGKTANEAFKNAVINTLRSLSTMMNNHQYHAFPTSGNDSESS